MPSEGEIQLWNEYNRIWKETAPEKLDSLPLKTLRKYHRWLSKHPPDPSLPPAGFGSLSPTYREIHDTRLRLIQRAIDDKLKDRSDCRDFVLRIFAVVAAAATAIGIALCHCANKSPLSNASEPNTKTLQAYSPPSSPKQSPTHLMAPLPAKSAAGSISTQTRSTPTPP